MCGFVGYVSQNHSKNSDENLRRMSKKILSRGPDDYGSWSDPNAGINLAFRRLAIIDLTKAGHQPMESKSGRYIIVFNGEIYNYSLLKKEADKNFGPIAWNGRSDTEVLLFLIEMIGLEATLKKCIGMFSIGVWDRKDSLLHIARDRFGEKPLYYGWSKKDFLFGSDLSSFKAFPAFNNELCPKAIGLFLNYSYVPAPYSIYKDIFKVQPGHIISFKIQNTHAEIISSTKYWDLKGSITDSKNQKFHSEEEGLADLKISLTNSIKSQMVSDVPIGAFLSGGIDSSLITAMMQEQSGIPIQTYTIGFEDKQFDESVFAKEVADFLGTNHTEVILSETDALNVVPNLPAIYSEPFADSSQIPTFLVSQIAKRDVTVALSGDGGDELFGGYNRYFWGQKMWKKVNWIPFSSRKLIAKSINAIPVKLVDKTESMLKQILKESGITQLNNKLHKLSSRLEYIHSQESLYSSLCTEWNNVNCLLNDKYQLKDNSAVRFHNIAGLSDIENMMFWDIDSYLKEDILTKVDRAAMANSLETRAPFLDITVAKSAWRFKENFLIDGFKGKMPLRKILESYVPRKLFERPKSGFGIPIGSWLRGPLKGWALSLLNENEIRNEGILKYETVIKLWEDHINFRYDNTVKLWNILVFRSWMVDNNKN